MNIVLYLSCHWDGTLSLWDSEIKRHHGASDEVHVNLTLTEAQDSAIRDAYRAKWPAPSPVGYGKDRP